MKKQQTDFPELEVHLQTKKRSKIYLLLAVLALIIHFGFITYNQTINWRKCIETSNLTDLECVQCDNNFPLSIGYNIF